MRAAVAGERQRVVPREAREPALEQALERSASPEQPRRASRAEQPIRGRAAPQQPTAEDRLAPFLGLEPPGDNDKDEWYWKGPLGKDHLGVGEILRAFNSRENRREFKTLTTKRDEKVAKQILKQMAERGVNPEKAPAGTLESQYAKYVIWAYRNNKAVMDPVDNEILSIAKQFMFDQPVLPVARTKRVSRRP